MTTLGAENTYNIKYTLASEDNKVLHDIDIDDMGEHFIESADEDLATFKMAWPNNGGLCWGRVTEHPQDNDYFYIVKDGKTVNVTSGVVMESLEIDRLPLVGWDCWTEMNNVTSIFNMGEENYTVTIGNYTFTMLDNKEHLTENIEHFKKGLSQYGSKRMVGYSIHKHNSVPFRLKTDIIDYKQVFPIFVNKSDYIYNITEDAFLYKMQNIWNRIIIGQQSYIDEDDNLVQPDAEFNLDLSNKLHRQYLTLAAYDDNPWPSISDGKNDTVIKQVVAQTNEAIELNNLDALDVVEQQGNSYKEKIDSFNCISYVSNASTIRYYIPSVRSIEEPDAGLGSLKEVKTIKIDTFSILPASFLGSLWSTKVETLSLTNVTELGNSFCNLPSSITKIELPNTLTKIGSNCFIFNFGVIPKEDFSITIPESVTEIGKDAFIDVPKIYYKGTATGAPWGAKEVITEF